MAAISEAMLAQALKEYLGNPPSEFTKFLIRCYPKEGKDLDLNSVQWADGAAEKGLTMRITMTGQGQETKSSDDYVITIEKI